VCYYTQLYVYLIQRSYIYLSVLHTKHEYPKTHIIGMILSMYLKQLCFRKLLIATMTKTLESRKGKRRSVAASETTVRWWRGIRAASRTTTTATAARRSIGDNTEWTD